MIKGATLFRLCAGIAVACLSGAPLSAQKTDVIVLISGDRITGEIKSLDRASLRYSTDHMGTLSIKWDKIVQVSSVRYFEVEDMAGRRYYGTLTPDTSGAGRGRVVIAVAEYSDTVPLLAIVRMFPIGRSFLARVDGFVNLGFTLQRANRLRQLSADGDAQYRTREWLTELQGSTYFQDQENVAATTRNFLELSRERFLRNRWLTLVAGQLEQNDELELHLRGLIKGGVGRFLAQTNRTQLLVDGGLSYTNERFTGSDATSNLEALANIQFEYFRLDSPKSNVMSTVSMYPSLTDPGRVRLDLDARVSHEVFKDFTVGFSVFDRFDSRPPSATASKNDYGVTFTVGWTF